MSRRDAPSLPSLAKTPHGFNRATGKAAPVAWLIVLAPFGLAWAWWTFSDASGLTKKREMDALDAKKEARRQKALEALGRSDKQRR